MKEVPIIYLQLCEFRPLMVIVEWNDDFYQVSSVCVLLIKVVSCLSGTTVIRY
jgi:hypothetical protein